MSLPYSGGDRGLSAQPFARLEKQPSYGTMGGDASSTPRASVRPDWEGRPATLYGKGGQHFWAVLKPAYQSDDDCEDPLSRNEPFSDLQHPVCFSDSSPPTWTPVYMHTTLDPSSGRRELDVREREPYFTSRGHSRFQDVPWRPHGNIATFARDFGHPTARELFVFNNYQAVFSVPIPEDLDDGQDWVYHKADAIADFKAPKRSRLAIRSTVNTVGQPPSQSDNDTPDAYSIPWGRFVPPQTATHSS